MINYIRNNYRNGFNSIINHFVLNKKNIEYVKKPFIRGRLRLKISKDGHLSFGSNCRINSCKWANNIGGDSVANIVIVGTGKVIFGNNVGMSNSTIVARSKVVIDDDVRIGGNCRIYDNDFHSLDYEQRLNGFDGIKSAPIHIKKGAFIGAHTIILKGVTIGEKSIIGAGSVVTKAVPDGEVWAGNPACFIKKI